MTSHSADPISVVIPASNCEDLTVNCLNHLAWYGGPLEVIYVDGGSERWVLSLIREQAELLGLKLSVIRNETNVGFTKAVNQGLEASRGKHVLVLNNDCYVGPFCIANLRRQLERHPKVALTAPLTGDAGHQSLRNPRRLALAGLKQTPADLSDPVACAELCRRDGVTSERTLAFFCALLHRDAIAELGPLQKIPEFESGLGADNEWCLRALRAGWKNLLVYNAFAAHRGGESFRRLGIDRPMLLRRAVKKVGQLSK